MNNLIKTSFAFFTDSPALRAPSLMHKGGLGWVRNSVTEILKNYTEARRQESQDKSKYTFL